MDNLNMTVPLADMLNILNNRVSVGFYLEMYKDNNFLALSIFSTPSGIKEFDSHGDLQFSAQQTMWESNYCSKEQQDPQVILLME